MQPGRSALKPATRPVDTPLMSRPAATALLLGWALIYSRDPSAPRHEWKEIGAYATEWVCNDVREGEVDRAIAKEIGSALASQPADNPMRATAWTKAQPRVRPRYRCERE